MIIGQKKFNTKNQCHIMGILNLTPDSFCDGGQYNDLEKAITHVKEMIAHGATIIDVGGMSTRPGHQEITVEEEINRVIPVLKAMDEELHIAVSLDTYRSEVVEVAAPYIDMVNDISGFSYDSRMADTIARHDLSLCIMAHKNHKSYDELKNYDHMNSLEVEHEIIIHNFIEKVKVELEEGLTKALNAGISKDKIMIDGGVGFGKTYEQNLMIINHTKDLVQMGYPVLMATSNKGFMREITGNMDINRSHETVATTMIGATQGASFFRVHDVQANMRALDMYQAISTCNMPKLDENQ